MFGFLRGSRSHRRWRQAYARVCQQQHLLSGISSLPALSYEAVFTYLLAQDLGWVPALPASSPTCCRLRASSRSLSQPDHKVAEFSVNAGLLLLGVKLDDDVRDDRSWTARAIRWWLRRPLNSNREYFRSLDPEFLERIENTVQDHLKLETSTGIELERYSAPTGRAFAELFATLAHLREDVSPEHVDLLQTVGDWVGRAIIAFDCAADFYRDQSRGRFNPLANDDAVGDAILYAAQCLSQAGWCIQRTIGPADSVKLLHDACRRVLRFPWRRRADWTLRLRDWGFRRTPGYTMARCDCGGCDCGGCDCGGCDPDCGSGGCEAGCCDSQPDMSEGCIPCCIVVPCDCSAACCECPASASNQRHGKMQGTGQASPEQAATPPDANDYESYIDRIVTTRGALNPAGLVVIDDRSVPAESEVGWISSGETVIVVSATGMGVVVRPYREDLEP